MLDAKFPPPNPAVAAISRNPQYGVDGFRTAMASSRVGISSSNPLTTVQLRPPNLGTANVYGIRSIDPTKFGTATRKNSWAAVKPKL